MTLLLIAAAYWACIAFAATLVLLLLTCAWLSLKDRIEHEVNTAFIDEDYEQARREALMLSVLIAEMQPSEDLSDPIYVPREWAL